MSGILSGIGAVRNSLSGRLLLLTAAFVLISEVLIYVPSISRFRLVYLNERLESGHLATLALEAAPEGQLSQVLEDRLLDHAMVAGVVLRRHNAARLMLSGEMPPKVEATYDLREATAFELIVDAFVILADTSPAHIRVLGKARTDPETVVEVILDEAGLRAAMIDFSNRILVLSLVISLLSATLVYISLHWLMVRPMRHITANLESFRRNPENAANVIEDTDRPDEIGRAQQALGIMQRDLRAALMQKNRLAALGAAMGKINHDLRNSLASAMIVSDRLTQLDDPEVRRVAPRLMKAIDRAVKLCSQTLDYAQADSPTLDITRVDLQELVTDVAETVQLTCESVISWQNRVPAGMTIEADRDQLFRVLFNLASNAAQAMTSGGSVTFTASRVRTVVEIDIADTGPGLPPRARENLFQPFAGSVRAGGTGLGLAIAREIARSHGGDIALKETGESGTVFRLTLPANLGKRA